MLARMETVAPRIDALLDRAALLCEARGARLTELPRDVLALILAAPGHAHSAQSLICRTCGHATEIEDAGLAHALDAAAERAGFSVTRATIEAEGMCAGSQS
jgi:Fe2+ or Zn2+ uptake regulation protein